MILSFPTPTVYAWWQVFVVNEFHDQRKRCYQWLLNGLKTIANFAWIKLFLRLNRWLENSLYRLVQRLRLLEKTWLLRGLNKLGNTIIGVVAADGLKFVLALTVLGYGITLFLTGNTLA